MEDVDLPRRLLQVEFKSLMVTEPSRTRPASRTVNGHSQGKNFKRFRKVGWNEALPKRVWLDTPQMCVCACILKRLIYIVCVRSLCLLLRVCPTSLVGRISLPITGGRVTSWTTG